jgi:hypothetical protein
MKRSLAACVAMLLASISVAVTTVATAQQPLMTKIEGPTTTLQQPVAPAGHFTPPSLSAPPVTPELWIYAQELQRHDDPAQAVRRKAEIKADQRMSRLAALKWYGMSNSRPDASVTPTMGIYSPAWIGNGWNRYDWIGGGTSVGVHTDGYGWQR